MQYFSFMGPIEIYEKTGHKKTWHVIKQIGTQCHVERIDSQNADQRPSSRYVYDMTQSKLLCKNNREFDTFHIYDCCGLDR